MATLYRYPFTVRGQTSFPLDMLRYDRCLAARREDVDAIQECIANPHAQENWTINLVSYVNEATVARWASFGWTVIEQKKREKVT